MKVVVWLCLSLAAKTALRVQGAMTWCLRGIILYNTPPLKPAVEEYLYHYGRKDSFNNAPLKNRNQKFECPPSCIKIQATFDERSFSFLDLYKRNTEHEFMKFLCLYKMRLLHSSPGKANLRNRKLPKSSDWLVCSNWPKHIWWLKCKILPSPGLG
jgi:hypothetical protein